MKTRGEKLRKHQYLTKKSKLINKEIKGDNMGLSDIYNEAKYGNEMDRALNQREYEISKKHYEKEYTLKDLIQQIHANAVNKGFWRETDERVHYR